jgi:2-polyprenyl-6-methoxyphenol hydroxylase-like FAD-dependent oxidoreductase
MVDAAALIVGCGPTGLIVAHELLRRGISCRLVDFSLLLLPGDAAKDPVIERDRLEATSRFSMADDLTSAAWFVKMERL